MQNRALKISLFLVCGWFQSAQASKLCIYELIQIGRYQTVSQAHLTYDSRKIFMDPRDTETVAAVGLSLVRPGDHVLDLGSGSGIPTQSYVLQGGAGYAVGLDVSPEGIQHAQSKYGSENLVFALGDYTQLTPQQIIDRHFHGKAPDVVVSNPPYVPSVGVGEGLLRTINGGPDGLRFIRRVIEIGAATKARLGFITGSYSSPVDAFQILKSKGYRVTGLTFSVLPFGDFSETNREQILRLESQGKAYLLRDVVLGKLAYVAIGVTAEIQKPGEKDLISEAEFSKLLESITKAKTFQLETLPKYPTLPVRVLILGETPEATAHRNGNGVNQVNLTEVPWSSEGFLDGMKNLGLILNNLSDNQTAYQRLQRDHAFNWKDEDMWPVLYRMMEPYYRNSSEFRELVSLIMLKASRPELTQEEHRRIIRQWAKVYTPDIEWLWPEEVAERLKNLSKDDPVLATGQDFAVHPESRILSPDQIFARGVGDFQVVPESGILDDYQYFKMVQRGAFPLIDHHNLITHFTLLLDHRLVGISKQLATLYVDNMKILHAIKTGTFKNPGNEHRADLIRRITRRLENIVRIWHGFQERRFVFVKGNIHSKPELAVLGGTPATRLFWAHPNMPPDEIVDLITDLNYFSALDHSNIFEPLDSIVNAANYPQKEHNAVVSAAEKIGISDQDGTLGWRQIRDQFVASYPASTSSTFDHAEFLKRMKDWETRLAGNDRLAKFLDDENQFRFWVAYMNLIEAKTASDSTLMK